MKKIFALLLVPILAFGAIENIQVDSLDGKVKQTTQGHVGSVSKPIDFSDVSTLGIGGSGGGGTPGGANQQFQWNNSFTFGGVPYTTYNGTMVQQQAGGRYQFVDPTDLTKRVQLSISGVTGLKTVSIFDNSVTVTPVASAVSKSFVTHVDGSGVQHVAQPTFSDLAGQFTLAQTPSTTASKLIGRGSSGAGAFQEITLGTNLTMTGTTLDATGGGGAPGGSTFELQYNNAGAFGGDFSFTSDGTSSFLRSGSTFFQDGSDPTKQFAFSLSNIPTSTLRSVVVPAGANPVIVNGVAAATSNQFVTHITQLGVQTTAQPAFSNLSGVPTLAQQNIPIGKSRWVDATNGVDISGSTNLARPYLTIAAALAAASSGDVVYVGAGTFAQSTTPLVIPAGVSLVGAGTDQTLITTSVAAASNRAGVELGTSASMTNLTVQNTAATGVPVGNMSSSSAFTAAYISGVKIIGVPHGIRLSKTGTTGLQMDSVVITTQGDCFYQDVASSTTIENCQFISDGTATTSSRGVHADAGTVIFRDGSLTVGNASTSNVGADATTSGTTLELHNVSILRTGTALSTNLDLRQATSSVVGVEAVTRPDAAALTTSGTITELSRYAVRDRGLLDYTNLASPTRGDIIFYNGTNYVKLPAGLDGNVLTTHGTTADPEWLTGGGGGGSIDDTAFGVAWDGQTTTGPSQNATYDYFHLIAPNDDGKVELLNQVAGITNTDASGAIQTPLTAPAGAIVGTTDTQNLSNKWVRKRVLTTVAPGATPTINTDTTDVVTFTGVNADITNMSTNTTGTPVPGDTLRFSLTDDGTPRAITWGTKFEASPGQALPTTTVAGVRLDVGFVRNTVTGRWRCLASSEPISVAGSGTVTSVGITGTNGIGSSGGPITTSGSITLSLPITLAGTTGKTLTVSNSLTLAGTDGSTLNVGAGGTLGSNAFNSTAFLTSSNISDAVWGAAWNATTTIAPSKNAIYDWGHTFDTNDDGRVDVLDINAAGLVKSDALGNVSSAVAGTDYTDLSFRTISVSGQSNVVADLPYDTLTLVAGTGMTITTTPGTDTITLASSGGGSGTVTSIDLAGTANQITVTGSSPITTSGTWTLSIPSSAQLSVAKLTNLTSNGFVKTGSGDGTLSIDTASYQPLDSDLTTIAGLTATTDNFLVSVSSAWASRTPSQVRTTLGLVIGTNVQAWDADLDTWATKTAPSGTVVGTTDTQTLTNKRVNPRTGGGCAETSSATSTPDSDACDQWDVTALAAADAFAAPTGTPVNGQHLTIRIKDNGTARALSFATGSSGQYRFSSDMAAPTTTVISKTMYLGFKWNSADSRWDNVAQLNNF